MKIGKAKYGGNKRTYFKIKDGDNTYRILPPIGDLADKGIWSVFYKVHYGYKNSEGKLRPFESPLVKNYKNKIVEVPDAALERIEKLKAQLEAAKKAGDSKLVAKLNEFVGPKGSFNLDSNHYVNAIDTQGNIGILKLRHRAKVALDAVMKKLRENGVDPLDPDTGRFFTITRSGTGLDTTFQVNVATKKMNIPGVGDVQQEIVHTLDEGIIARLSTEAADLSKLFKKPTSSEVARIVAEGAVAVDEILDGKGQGTEGTGGGEDYDDSGDYADDSSSAQSAAPTTAATAGLTATTQVAEAIASVPGAAEALGAETVAKAVAAPLKTETASVQAAPAPVQTAAPVATAPATTAAQVNEMSDADFLKSLGL